MSNIKYQYHAPYKKIRNIKHLSERTFCENFNISRMTLRSVESDSGNLTLESLGVVAEGLNRKLAILLYPEEEPISECSVVAVSIKVKADGFDSWVGHFMEFVDEFRRSLDPRLLILPPVSGLDLKLKALLASIVLELSAEINMDPPQWSKRSYFLEQPWFLSETESLRASALVESPVYYRKNNIFVLENFLRRA